MQLFGYLDILSFVRVGRLNWIGHVNVMDSRRKVSQVFNNNPQGSRLRGRSKNRRWNCVQTNINKCKITDWKERSKSRADWEMSSKEAKGRNGLRRIRRSRRRRRRRRRRCCCVFCIACSESLNGIIWNYPDMSLKGLRKNLSHTISGPIFEIETSRIWSMSTNQPTNHFTKKFGVSCIKTSRWNYAKISWYLTLKSLN